MPMNYTMKEVLEFIKENDVQFIRLAFCDLFGLQKNISILPEQLPGAFEHGISFDAHAVKGFYGEAKSDLLLFPDPATLSVMPWRPGPGHVVRFYCDIKNPDGTASPLDCRQLLKRAVERCENLGYMCKIGAECEFYLFKTDENGDPTQIPLDKGTYLDISPLDKGENIRREICLCLKEIGVMPESSHHEQGPGQNEIDFEFGDALQCADNLQTFKSVVKAIATRNGLFASFMAKPLMNAAGNGLHVNLSLSKNGVNIFKNKTGEHSAVAESFIAGILDKVPEMTMFLNPTVNSYERFGQYEAPKYVSWSHQNRSQLIRIPAATGERIRMELRSPDPSLNPYLAYALLIFAGLDGIENELKLPPAVDTDLFLASETETKGLERLPDHLGTAISLAKESAFISNIVGENILNQYVQEKTMEVKACSTCEEKEAFYRSRYFEII